MSNTDTDYERCEAPTPDGPCQELAAYQDGRCHQHTDAEPVRNSFLAVTEGGELCSDCGQLFSTEAAYDAHDCPGRTSKTKAAKSVAKKGGSKAKQGGVKSIVYLFDEKDEVTAALWGLSLGYLWGHDPLQAYALLGASTGIYLGGMGSSAKGSLPVPRAKLKQLGKNSLQLLLAFGAAVAFIITFHGEPDAPLWYYQLLDQFWELLGVDYRPDL